MIVRLLAAALVCVGLAPAAQAQSAQFKGWSAVPVTFPRAEGSLWHNWSPPLMILKYTKEGQTQSDAEVAYTLGDK